MAFFHCAFSGEQRKGDVFPDSLMCISCFQCLRSTMREVTRNNLTWLLSLSIVQELIPQKMPGEKVQVRHFSTFFPHFSAATFNPHGVFYGVPMGMEDYSGSELEAPKFLDLPQNRTSTTQNHV